LTVGDFGFTVRPLSQPDEVKQGDDVGLLIANSASGSLQDGDVVVVSHKVVSKAEGCVVSLASVEPSEEAINLAAEQSRDPRHVQVILDQSAEVLRAEHGVLICVTHHGFVCANAGVDESNVPAADHALTLPRFPDESARAIRARLLELTGATLAVVIADSFGRAWRFGQVDVAIGCAGLAPMDDWRGRTDRDGRNLVATELAVGDSIAAAADLARGKDSGQPFVVVSGLGRFVTADDGPGAAALLRPKNQDLFRR